MSMNGRVDGILNKGMRVYLSVVVREARAGQLSAALAETSLPGRKDHPTAPQRKLLREGTLACDKHCDLRP
jgi:hypothetical protein